MTRAERNAAWTDRIINAQWDAIQERIGKDQMPVEELGCGHYGCVMTTRKPGLVFKLTSDASEAAFVSAALSLPEWPAGLIRYYDIFELPAKHRGRRVFVLLRQEADHIGALCGSVGELMKRYGKRYGDYSVAEFDRNLTQWLFSARRMREQLRRAKDPVAFLARVHAKRDEAWNIYSDDRGYEFSGSGPHRVRKVLQWHRGPLAFELRHILLEQLAMTMANTHAGSLIGEAFGYYMEEGMLLADVHCRNLGEAVPEGYDSADLVITDPGHMVPLDVKWLDVEVQVL